MISRVAESCFWLHRYIERADSVARLLRVNRSFVLDVRVEPEAQWGPVAIVCGEEERLVDLFGDDALNDGEQVQDHLTWSERNPGSIYSSIRWARENARTIRETISLEMWECINSFWHWISGRKARALYSSDRDAFYSRVRDVAALFLGLCRQTVLHDEPFAFMQLGVMLERAGHTARIIDFKHNTLAADGSVGAAGPETAIEAAQAMALLRSCSAIEPFFKHTTRMPAARPVVAFLYGEPLFPRSILHCALQASALLSAIREETGHPVGMASASLVGALLASVQKVSANGRFETEVHEELTRVINAVAEVCNAVHSDFFDPRFGEDKESQPQSQSQVQS